MNELLLIYLLLMDNQPVVTPSSSDVPSGFEALMDNVVVSYIFKILGAILVIIILLLISKILANVVKRNIIKNSADTKHADKVGKVVHDIVFYILVIFSFFVGFEMVGFNVGLILGGISFGVGLAFKEILGNMIAGIMMLYTKEFKLGDIVEINADQVYFGRIEEITIRYTIIRTLDLRQVVLPNMTLISVPIKTFSSESLIRLIVPFWTHYDTDVALAIKIIADVVNSFGFVKEKENTKVFLSNFLDSSLEFKSMFFFDPNCGLLVDQVNGFLYEKANEEFNKHGIVVPYNMLTLTFENNDQKNVVKQQLDTVDANMGTNVGVASVGSNSA